MVTVSANHFQTTKTFAQYVREVIDPYFQDQVQITGQSS